jgi:alpha-galactosidase
MGTYHDEPVLLIESSIGNRSLAWDFRPPSSGRTQPDNKYEGYEYRALIEGVTNTLAHLEDIVPRYAGQGYEIAGFVWWQGHKDAGISKADYEQHLVNLIQDLRKDLDAPQMRVAIATVGFSGYDMNPQYQEIHAAQIAASDPVQHPELSGQVATVDTRAFWLPMGSSPTGTGYHYNHNAETYVLTGDALGRAMVALMGGDVEPLELPTRPAMHPDVALLYSDNVISKWVKPNKNPTPEQYQAMTAAICPILLDRMIPDFIAAVFGRETWRFRGLSLADLVNGVRPKRDPASIESQLDTLISYYAAAGIHDYGWKVVDPQMEEGSWYYYSFDPPEKLAPENSGRYREITFPDGMEDWHKPDFDPVAAGWQQGHAPFGQRDGKLLPVQSRCYQPLCGCNQKPATLWEKEVLLMRQTFDLPPARDGHVYRFILGGAGCDRTGEGFAIYINGKPLTEIKGGYFKNPGIRGAYVYADTLPELKKGKVTIAVINFLRYTFYRNRTSHRGRPIPPNGSVRIWLEEAKLPPAVLEAVAP